MSAVDRTESSGRAVELVIYMAEQFVIGVPKNLARCADMVI